MRTETRSFYEAAVVRAVVRIAESLDEALDLVSSPGVRSSRRSISIGYFAAWSARRPWRCIDACALRGLPRSSS